MKNKITTLLLLFALLVAAPAFAQTATYQTVTSAAQTATSTTVTLLSMSNMVASSQGVLSLMFCDGEAYKINSINTTSLVASVTRGYDVTNASAHASGVVCFYGVQGGATQTQLFITQDKAGFGGNANLAPITGGVCTRTDYPFLPLVNIQNNSLVDCVGAQSATGAYRWRATSLAMFTGAEPYTSRTNADYQITLADKYVTLFNLGAARTATLPWITGEFGHVVVVKNDGTANSITVAAPFGQYIGSPGTTSATITPTLALKLISVQNPATGAWGWLTVP